MTSVRIVAATHTGNVRSKNEDRYGATGLTASSTDGEIVTTEVIALPCLAVVADGLGGHPSGDLASAIAVERLLAEEPEEPSHLVSAIHRANSAVVDAMLQGTGSVGMGTTVAAVLVHKAGLTVANVGDSTVLEFENGRLVQLSTDDALSGGSNLPGLPSAVVTQSLGGSAHLTEVKPHIHEDTGAPPRRLLLSTDGLTSFVPRHQLTDALRHDDPEHVVKLLIGLALNAGAPDNVTCILLDLM